jgi:hypothetical protein
MAPPAGQDDELWRIRRLALEGSDDLAAAFLKNRRTQDHEKP